ncbi:MAG: ATP-NAD kinase family protein [Promethearchaeota archaeon]
MSNLDQFNLGLIINPISGMGGSVGLKGTDGKDILQKAIELGAVPNAFNRTKQVLRELESIKKKIKFYTCPGRMGEDVLKELDFDYELVMHPIFNNMEDPYGTSAEHTKIACKYLKKIENLKLLLFAGGDGTARDILSVIEKDIPCLGIPTGVKIYSSVFSLNPKDASILIMQFLWDEAPIKESEVLDIDEDAYREGKLVSRLFGYMLTPYVPEFSQPSKLGTPDSDLNNQERIARRIVENLEEGIYYLLGPGTTIKAITDLLGLNKTILGVDLLYNREIIGIDLNGKQILNKIKRHPTKIIISLIGRQGFLFGRGNLQFTPEVIKTVGINNIILLSTQYKLRNIPNQILRIDTRDPELDEQMKGLYRVITDYDQIKICEVK